MSDVRPLSDLADAILDDDDVGRNVGKFGKQRSLQDLHGPKKRQWKPNVSNKIPFFFFFKNVRRWLKGCLWKMWSTVALATLITTTK